MAIETKNVCPLGSECERISGNSIVRCAWYTCLAGQHPQTGEMIDEWKCAMAWIPIMLVENANTRSVAAATESFRNEVIKGTELTNNILLAASQISQMRNISHHDVPTVKTINTQE